MRLMRGLLALFLAAGSYAGQQTAPIEIPRLAPSLSVQAPAAGLSQNALQAVPTLASVPQFAVAAVQTPLAASVQAEQAASFAAVPQAQAQGQSPEAQAQTAAKTFDGLLAITDAPERPVFGQRPAVQGPSQFALVANAASLLKRHHVDRPSVDRLLNKALSGLLEKAGATTYKQAMPHFRALRAALGASAHGMGMSWAKPMVGPVYVSKVDSGSPADHAGIMPGDTIEQVDGQSTWRMSGQELSAKLGSSEPVELIVGRLTEHGDGNRYRIKLQAGHYKQTEFHRLIPGIVDVFTKAAQAYAPAAAPEALLDAALTKMGASLDRFTEYFTATEARDFAAEFEEQTYGGFGFQLARREETGLVIGAVMPGSPAFRAGLRAGDRIVGIDGHPAAHLNPIEASKLLKREVGSAARVMVQTPDGTRRTILLNAEKLSLPLAGGGMMSKNVAYVQFTIFSEPALADLRNTLMALHDQGARDVILDLRFNGGGRLDVATELAQDFMGPNREIMTMAGTGGKRTAVTQGTGMFADMTVLVLVNGMSASASEVVAAALRENFRALIVGEQTFGKGVGQEGFGLLQGRGLKITTFRWFSPKGNNLTIGSGIKPDVVVPVEESEHRAIFEKMGERLFGQRAPALGEDATIDAAWKLLTKDR